MMVGQSKRLKAGDILEVTGEDRFGYLQYIGKDPFYGHAVLVSPRRYDQQMPVAESIFSGGYVAFYPATAALAQRLAKVVGRLPAPNLPRRVRRPGGVHGQQIGTWLIDDDNGTVIKEKLSEEDLQLPIGGVWNHDYLLARLRAGWHPEQAVDTLSQ